LKESFVMYTAYYEKTKMLSDEEMGKLIRAIFEYEKQENTDYKIEICKNLKDYPTVSIAFMFIADDLDRLNEKYKNKVDAGKKGAEIKKQKQADDKQNETKDKHNEADVKQKQADDKQSEAERSRSEAKPSLYVYDNDNVNDNVYDNVLNKRHIVPSSSSSTPPVIQIPLNDGSLYDVEENQAREWKELFPAVDVLQELRKMKAWCDANPSRRKTKRGIKRFVVKWLMSEQDKGRQVQRQNERTLPSWYKNESEQYEKATDEEIAEFKKMLEEQRI
jgi:hypothetical protein